MSFSVVTPNFNHGKMLARAVDAVMAWELRPAELITINDGSTDDSLTVIGGLKLRYPSIRLINHEQNRGVLTDMNEGLRAASGEFVYMAAPATSSSPACLPRHGRRCSNIRTRPISAGGVVLFDPQGRLLGVRPFMQPSARAAFVSPAAARAGLAKRDNWSVGAGVIYRRRRLLAAGGSDETIGAFGDGLMVRRMALESGFCFDPALVAV